MKASLVRWMFSALARLSLRALHSAGGALGVLIYLLDGRYANRLYDNLAYVWHGQPEAAFRKVLHANVREMGKSILELPWVWRRPLEQVLAKVQRVEGREHFTAARERGKGVIVLTPHLGSFEIVGLYVAAAMPMTCMYRVPRMRWLDQIIRSGRERGQMKLAPADVSGVRALLKALKRGEAIGVLPDQVPGNGEGEWVDFFGRPAYTITLAGRLIEASGASVLLAYGERLPDGEGYVIHFSPLALQGGEPVTRQINAAQEALIRQCPAQYLWSYNRYKVPAGANPPPAIQKENT